MRTYVYRLMSQDALGTTSLARYVGFWWPSPNNGWLKLLFCRDTEKTSCRLVTMGRMILDVFVSAGGPDSNEAWGECYGGTSPQEPL